jgi:hypothetical protein
MASEHGRRKSQRRLNVIVLASALALAAICAEAFIADSLDHDCCGEGCPVCAQIDAARRLLDGLARVGAALTALLFAAAAKTRVRRFAPVFCALTPVCLKTKITC